MARRSEPGDVAARLPVRHIARKTRVELPNFGFAGREHVAVQVFGPSQLERTDPFVLLTDNELGFEPGEEVGRAQPHAGMETIWLIVEGALMGPEGRMSEGDMCWISAGRGVLHDRYTSAAGRARVLQVWLALSRQARESDPAIFVTPRALAPTRSDEGAEVRLYCDGAGSVSPMHNATIFADIRLDGGSSAVQSVPGAVRGFVYVIGGALRVAGTQLFLGDVGWIEPVNQGRTELKLTAWAHGARAILIAAPPLDEKLVHRGLFVAGSRGELAASMRSFEDGEFPLLSQMVRSG